MNRHYNSNYEDRQYRNNNNMTHSHQKGPSSFSITDYHNHSSSNDNHNHCPGPTSSSFHGNPSFNHGRQSQQMNESRREARERRERDFIPLSYLMEAVQANNERMVKEICRKLFSLPEEDVRAIANFKDLTGRTPLSYACGGGSIAMTDELTRIKYIDPMIPDNDGNTPLHYCSQAGYSEAVDLMIARFGDVLDLNARNSTGLTPLMKAALQGRTRCAKSLLSAGAYPNIRDYSRGLTAAEWAKLCGRHICSEIIIRSAKEAQRHSGSPSMNFTSNHKMLPSSRSNMELKRMSSDESPYYHLYARSTLSGATWLKNKIRKALGANPSPSGRARPPISDGSYTLMGGATICAGSLLFPSIKPLIEEQRVRQSMVTKKLTIPTLQVTPVKR